MYKVDYSKKKLIIISSEIHNYLKPNTINIQKLKNEIINNDLKLKWNEILTVIKKQFRYAENETLKYQNLSNKKIIFFMFWKPILWFFGWWIKHRLFLKWIPWLIYCFYMAFYQFTIFALLYEKRKYK